jgi:FemAB-related protein (PEP-CTERM system-associated)
MGITVSLLTLSDERAWDAYVRDHPDSTFFHLSGWKSVIERAFRHRTHYLISRRNGILCGVLPLTEIRSPLFGHSLISNAFCVGGGPLASDAESSEALMREAVRLGRELKVNWIEIRTSGFAEDGWVEKAGLYVGFRRPILADSDANLKAIPRKQRAMVRKAISLDLRSEVDDDVDRLHDIYARSVRYLGTPVFSKRYFCILKEQFGSDCDVITVMHGPRPVASVMNFYFRDEVLPYYGGGTRDARALAANDFLYWEVMRRACEKGLRQFDFGRSKIGTGSYHFKKNWGFEPAPLKYSFLPVTVAAIPDVNPLNPKYAPLIAAWRHLPLLLTKIIGPPIVRQIG